MESTGESTKRSMKLQVGLFSALRLPRLVSNSVQMMPSMVPLSMAAYHTVATMTLEQVNYMFMCQEGEALRAALMSADPEADFAKYKKDLFNSRSLRRLLAQVRCSAWDLLTP